MSNYNSLKTTINANIKQNGNQEITGQILNSVLNQMVTTLGTGYQFAGVATTATNPGSPDAKMFYIANGKGTYTNFGGLVVTEDDVVVLYWDSSWHKVSTGIASQEKLTELDQKVNGKSIPLPTNAIEGSLTGEGTIVTDYGLCHVMLDVSSFRGATITIMTTYDSPQYAFLQSYTETRVVFCAGCNRESGYPSNITIPNDANFIYLLCGAYSSPIFPYSIVTSKDDLGLDNEVKTLTKENRKLKIRSIEVDGRYAYDILIPTFNNDNYIRIPFMHVVNPAKNADNWRIICAYLSDGENDLQRLVTDGEWEMAVQLVGRPDFIGGGLHGNEVIDNLFSFIDGIPQTSPLYPVGTFVEGDEISFIEITKMYDPSNTSTQVATHRKFYTFTKDGLRLRQRIEWLGSYNLTYSYLAMFPVDRKSGNVQITETYHDDKNYILYDVSQSGFGGYPIIMKPGVKAQFLSGRNLGISASAEIVKFSPDVASRISFLSDSEYYNKMYFDFCGNAYSVNNGDVWETDVIYKLNQKPL